MNAGADQAGHRGERVDRVARAVRRFVAIGDAVHAGGEGERTDGERRVHGAVEVGAAIVLDGAVRQHR